MSDDRSRMIGEDYDAFLQWLLDHMPPGKMGLTLTGTKRATTPGWVACWEPIGKPARRDDGAHWGRTPSEALGALLDEAVEAKLTNHTEGE
jgi:hypothetical protein